MRHKKLLRLTLALLTLSVALGWAPPHFVRCGAARRRAARAAVRAADSSPPGEEPTEDSSQIYEDLRKWEGPGGSARSEEMEGFNKGLYDHLNNRPEYETAKMYDSLKARIDVDDPLKEEFARNRERIENNTGPAPDQTPGEVIDAVLLALQDVDFPTENHGVELLKKYTGDGSQLADEQNVTPEILRRYFESTKYGILISWVAVQYLKKIEISLDGQRASQEVPRTATRSRATRPHASRPRPASRVAGEAQEPRRRLGARPLPARPLRNRRRQDVAHRSVLGEVGRAPRRRLLSWRETDRESCRHLPHLILGILAGS